MAVQFNIDSRHNEDARFKKVLFGYDGELLEVELNEVQDIVNSRLGRIIERVFGNRPLYSGTYAIVTNTLTVTNELVAIGKELIFIPSVSLAVANGDTIYLNLQEKTVTQADTIKQYGALTGAGVVANYLQDSRLGEETTRRVQVTYQLTKIGTGTGTFLKLGTIASGAFVKATDYADSDLYKEIRRLSSEVITSDGVWTSLANHKASTTDHANATQTNNGFMSKEDKVKMDGIQAGSEVNQNAFSIVSAGGVSLVADSKTDTLTMMAGNAVNIAGDATWDTVTISVPNATTSANGAMSAADKTKLDGVASGAEVNQNAFSTVTAGGVTISSASKTSTLALAAGNAVSLTGDNTGKSVNIAVPNATQSANGAMSSADKTKLDGVSAGAEVNQNSFTTVKVGTTSIASASKTDTLEMVAGTNVSLTPDAVGKKVTITVPNATQSASGAMSSADKTKLDGVAIGAEVNQNSFATVKVGTTNVTSGSKSDTVEFVAGTGVALTPDAPTKKVTVAVDSTIETKAGAQSKADAVQTNLTSHIGSGGAAHANATTGVDGFMSAADKVKLNGIATGAEVNQNAFATVNAGGTNLASNAKSDTLTISGGANISVTGSGKTVTIAATGLETPAGAQSRADGARDAAIAWAQSFGLGTAAKYVDNVDLNVLTGTGFYRGSGLTNAPNSSGGWFYIIHLEHLADFKSQLAIRLDAYVTELYLRTKSGGIWTGWVQFATNSLATTSADGLMSAADKSKLNGIAAGANNYTHPATHPPSIIVQDASNRFVTDTEKSTWNGKASTAVATSGANGLMSAADKSKLDGVAAGAQPNQNSFATVNAGGTNLAAGSATDTLVVSGGANISVTGSGKTMTIAATGLETPSGAQAKANSAETNAISYAQSYGLGSSAKDISSTDLNALTTTSGFFRGSAITNAPDTGWWYIINQVHASSYVTQIATSLTGKTEMWMRVNTAGTWGAWKKVAFSDVASTSADGLMSKADKSKLDGVAAGANNYTHPATHPPSIIAQDASNRFVSDSEKSTWNGKASTAVATTGANGLMSAADKSKIDGIQAGAEVNQSAFATVRVNGTDLVASAKSDMLIVSSTLPITVTGNSSTDAMVIGINAATTSAAGSMSASDKTKMDSIEYGAHANPPGMMTMFGGSSAPSGWLLCQGQAVSRSTYSALYNAIGTVYGAGDGATTFNLPDMRGRVPVGLNTGETEFNALNKKGGAKTHTLTEPELARHWHSIQWMNATASGSGGYYTDASLRFGYGTGTAQTLWQNGIFANYAGGDQPHNNLQPYNTVNFIIKT